MTGVCNGFYILAFLGGVGEQWGVVVVKMQNKPGVGHRYGKRHIPGVMNKTEERY